MALSANGWPVLLDAPPKVRIPGTKIDLRVRPGDVATVLVEVARRFHEEIESLTLPVSEKPGYDDWSWAVRPVRGQTTGYSNHAAGCAIDLNATRHPRGVKGTFSRAETARMRRILASTFDAPTGGNVVRWGEDYRTTVDGMHFEVDASSAAVARVAARIRSKRAEPTKPTPKPDKKPEPIAVKEDDMASDEELPLGQWGIDVLRDADGKITRGQAEVVRTVALAQMNESIHAMAKAMAGMAADMAALRAELGKR